MDKRKKLRTAVELGKDILILLLTCSAVWMLVRGGLFNRLTLGEEDQAQVAGVQNNSDVQTQAVRPMRLTATLQGGDQPVRYTAQYDAQAVDALFQKSAGLLMETLSSAEQPQPVTRRDWEEALGRAPGLCFDFQGEMPLSALTGWLSVELSVPDALVCRVLLTVWEGSAALYYYDLNTQSWYRCVTQVVGAVQLENVLDGLSSNGAYYAFESDRTDPMAGDTLLVPSPEPLVVYTAGNPMSGGRGALEGLMTDLGFNLSACVFYSGAGEEVGRSGSDTLRMSKDGVVEYHTDVDGPKQFPVNAIPDRSEVFAAADACSRLLWQAVNTRSGQARTYLSRVEQTDRGWVLEFEYSLNAIPVSMKNGPAARFEVTDGQITAFTLRLRSYTAGENRQILLPPIQAAAAMAALELDGRELQVMYRDGGEEWVSPNWTAISEEG